MEWVLDLVLMGTCVLIIYFQRGRKYAWAPGLAISCLAIAGVIFFLEVPKSISRPPAKPMPKAAEVRKAFEASAVTATSDMLYHGAGFSIQIPEGFSYAKLEEPMMLMASRRDHGTGISVLRHDLGHDDPGPTVREMLDLLKKGNNTYEFSPLNVDAQSQFSTWFRVTKNGVRLRGFLVFAERDDKLWQLTLTEPATEQDAALYRIAQTWSVD